jgi:hypothetical protein
MIPKYAILESREKDGVCPIMIAEGDYDGVVFEIDAVGITEDGVLSYNYNVISGEVDESFYTLVGDIIVHMVTEKDEDGDRE